MANYYVNNDGTITKGKKKKDLVDNVVDFGKGVFNLPTNVIKGVYDAGKSAVDEVGENGYQFGDITKTGLKTVGNIATNVTHGTVKALENFYDFTENASSNINTRLNEKLGIQTKEQAANERAKAQEIIKRDLTTEAENALGWTDELRNEWEKGSLVKRENIGGQVSQAVGEMLPTLIVGNAVGSVPSNATKVQKLISTIPTTQTLGVSSYGGALEQAYNEGATTSQANKYALGSALTEVATEWLTGGVPGVNDKGVLDSLEEKTLNKVSNNLARFIIKEGYNVVGEGAEEALSEIINPILKNATYSQGEKVNWNDVIRSAIVGGITGGILDLPGNISTYKSNANIQQQNQGNLSENTQNSINLPPQQESPLAKLQRNNIEQKQQINQQVEQELATRRNGINQELSLPTVSTEGMNLMESASRYNIKPETQSAVQNLMENRGIESRWDATRFSDNSVNALWTKDANGNRQVIFNPNASLDTIVEEVAVHELTHDILSSKNTTLNSQEVLNYVKTLQGYNKARQSLENTYAAMYDPNSEEFNSLIDEEVVADVLGRKLGNQEFINQLVDSKPSVAKSIYNWVVNKLNSIVNKGKVRSEKLYWQNIKNNFENAYKQEYKNNEMASTKYKVSNNNINKLTPEGITMTYVRNPNANTQYYGDTFGQNLEPAGEYMNMDTMQGKNKIDGLEYGTIRFNKPLVLDNIDTTANGWKKLLSDRYNGLTGKKLSNAIKNDGYDAVMTRDENGNIWEVVNLNGTKDNPDIRYSKKNDAFDSLLTNKKEYDLGTYHKGISNKDNSYDYNKVYTYDIRNGGKGDNVQVSKSRNGYVWNNALLSDSIKGKGEGTKIALDLNKQSLEETGKPLRSLPEYNIVGLKNHTDEGKGLWESLVRKGYAVKNDDNTYTMLETAVPHEDTTNKDSEGKTLSKSQQEYFKDSKVRDAEGNLKVLYNGSGNHTTYNPAYMSDESIWGKGIYLSPFKEVAELYGNDVKKAYVNITNPITPGKSVTFEQYNDLYKAINDGEEAYREEYDMYDDDMDLLWDVTNKGQWADYADEIIKYTGKDGIIIDDEEFEDADRMVVAFKSNQIKNVDNTNPTSNEDIRYSKEAKEFNDFLDKNVKNKNNIDENSRHKFQEMLVSVRNNRDDEFLNKFREEIDRKAPNFFNKNTTDMGIKLTEDQQKYFEDSKARGINDSLKTVFHTTTEELPQFNEFNPVGTQYYRFGDQVVNYYTDSKEMSGSYAGQDYKMADTKKLNSIKEAEDYLKHISNLTGNVLNINKRNNLYTVTQDKQISKEAREFIKTLTEDENPTSDPDIRYSKQSEEWDKWNNKTIASEGTKTKLGDIKLPTRQKVSLPTKSTTEAKTSPVEPKKTISKSTLTQAETKELNDLKTIDEAIGLDSEEEARMKFLEKKQQGYVERYSGLKKITDFKEISREYGKYKDLSDFNDKLLKDAEKTIQGYRNTGRRTKAEWLDIAKNIGSNYKGNSEGLTKYAIQSWFEAQPNQKDTLNRQGDKYVDFKIQEWVNAVYDGARIGELEKPLVPTAQQPKKETTSIPMVKNNESLRVESQRIANEINKNETFKQKSWLKTATNSDVLKDSGLIKDLDPSQLNYVVQSNKSSVDKANNTINTLGYEKSLDKVKQIINDDKLPSASDVALMQRMIQEAAKRGDAATVQDLIMDTAIVGTDLGQATQALSIIQRLTPEGQLKLYTKLVQRAKIRGEKSFQNVEITPEMVENVLGAYNSDGTYDQDDLNARVEQFKQDLADQMKSTIGDKANAWRYLSMLGNPKTHIRNIVSNLAMNGTIKVKNAMARTLETILPVKERTKTWKPASQDVKEFAKQTTANMKDIITGEAKYNEKSAIESKKQIFKNKALEKLSNFNGNALEAEDWFFSSRAFQSTLQEYLTANGINTYEDIQNNPEIVEKAKNYAKDQAEIATFRQYSKLAATINQIEKKNKGAKLAVQALMPFKKTPINVAKAGLKYSPLGLTKTLIYDGLVQLRQGNIEASQFIDNLSQGLTGTSLTLLGYALAKAGILSGSGDDDKEGKYDSQLGNTGYSLNIGGNSYSISWLSPVAMPMLVGASAYEQLEENKEWDMNVVSDSLAKTLDPLNEMSFMQGITNALNSYNSGVDKWKGIGESTLQNYVGQFFPTVFSQLAATTDDVKRSTKASANSKYKFGEQTVRSIMYKIPGLRQKLEAATDIWGNEKEQSDNIIERAFESFIAPYSKTKHIETDLDKEIKRVYNETGETGVIPGIPNSYVKYKDETYRMSANEYTDYKKTYGQTAYNTLNKLINSNDYKQATDEDKVKMLEDVYKYARGKANQEYFDSNNIDYENDLLDKLDTLNDRYGISANTYFANKKEYDYAYQYPEKYTTIKQIAPYDKYNKYKDEITNIRNNTTNDKEETIKYINSLNMNVPQKAMFIKQYYKSFKQYDRQIAEYIAKQNLTRKEKETILKQLGFTIKDGRVYY